MEEAPRTDPYLVLTNTAYQEGSAFRRENCSRYRRASDRLTSGIESMGDLFDVARVVQLTSGRSRTLWTSIADLDARRMDVRFRSLDYSQAHVFELRN